MQPTSSQPGALARAACVWLVLVCLAGAPLLAPRPVAAQDATPESQQQLIDMPTPTPTPIPPTPTPVPPTSTPVPPTPTPSEPATIPEASVAQELPEQQIQASTDEIADDATPGSGEPSPTPPPAAVVPTAADVALACTPASTSIEVDGDPVAVTCIFRGGDTLAEREVTLSSIVITAPAGWLVSGQDGSATSDLVVPAGIAIGAGDVFDAGFRISAAGCDAPAGSVGVKSSFTFEASGAIAGPSTTVAVTAQSSPAVAPDVASGPLSFGASEASVSGYPTLTASVPVRITDGGSNPCADRSGAWALQVRTDGLYQVETAEHIPADAMVYLGTASSGAPGGLVPVAADVPLGAVPVTIAHLGDVTGIDGTWTAVFALAPPPGVPPGSYRGSITFTVVRAP